MSWSPLLDPTIPLGDAIETVIIPRARDPGGFGVRRALPSVQWQMVGPFIFFDPIGPAEFLTGKGSSSRRRRGRGRRCCPRRRNGIRVGDRLRSSSIGWSGSARQFPSILIQVKVSW